MILGMALKSYTCVAKGLKVNFRKFLGLIPAFAEVTEEKLVEGSFWHTSLNNIKVSK